MECASRSLIRWRRRLIQVMIMVMIVILFISMFHFQIIILHHHLLFFSKSIHFSLFFSRQKSRVACVCSFSLHQPGAGKLERSSRQLLDKRPFLCLCVLIAAIAWLSLSFISYWFLLCHLYSSVSVRRVFQAWTNAALTLSTRSLTYPSILPSMLLLITNFCGTIINFPLLIPQGCYN